jgi:hypothetical protein
MSGKLLRTPLIFLLAMTLVPIVNAADPEEPVTARKASTIQVDTKARLTLRTRLSTKLNEVGDPITATLAEPLYVDGDMVLGRGTEFIGQITKIERARRGQRSSNLAIRFDRVVTPSGELPIAAQVTAIDNWDTEESLKANDSGTIKGGHRGEKTIDNMHKGSQLGVTAGISGAGLAAAAGASGRRVLGIGAVGFAAGLLGGLLLTKGSDIKVAPGAVLRVRFLKAVTVLASAQRN